MSGQLPPGYVPFARPETPLMGKKGRANWRKLMNQRVAYHLKKEAFLRAGGKFEDYGGPHLFNVNAEDTVVKSSNSGSGSSEWVVVPKTAEELLKERIEKNLKFWPWRNDKTKWRSLVLVAPFKYRDPETPTLPYHPQHQSLLFVKLLRHPNVGRALFNTLWDSHSAVANLVQTCQEAFACCSWACDIWDMSSADFRNTHLTEDQSKEAAKKDPELGAWVCENLIVTPVRKPFYKNRDARYNGGRITYENQVKNLHLFCLSVYNWADNFKNLQLHHVPFLTTKVLALIIPQMRNLKVLGIYNCELLHIGTAIEILTMLKTDRPLGREHQIHLDFYPTFHQGPAPQEACADDEWEYNEYKTGVYGVSWDNLNMDTTIAIWALVVRIVSQARAQDIDFESPHTMFRKWLEKSPCKMVGETLHAMFNTTDEQNIAMMVDWRRTQGRPDFHFTRPDYPRDGFWAVVKTYCGTCNENLMGIFFNYGQIKALRDHDSSTAATCMGCQLNYQLENEADHYKQQKRHIIQRWLYDPINEEWNTTNLFKSINFDFYVNKVEKGVRGLDRMREYDIKVHGYDRETEERQIPLMPYEKGKRGGFLRSPECGEWLNPNAHKYDDHLPKHY